MPAAGHGDAAWRLRKPRRERDHGQNTDKIAADPAALTEEANTAVTELALRLLKSCPSDGDTLISPTSILCALAMTANGAEGETLSQLEDLFGMSADRAERVYGGVSGDAG